MTPVVYDKLEGRLDDGRFDGRFEGRFDDRFVGKFECKLDELGKFDGSDVKVGCEILDGRVLLAICGCWLSLLSANGFATGA